MKKKFLKKIKSRQTRKGFTLIEMLVSIFIFAMMMIAISGIFAKQINSYKHTRLMANNLENAQFALNYMSKTLRTSSIISPTDNTPEDDFDAVTIGTGDSLIIYDFSQRACMKFTFSSDDKLWLESQTGIVNSDYDIEDCGDPNLWGQNDPNVNPPKVYMKQPLTTGDVNGTFEVAQTNYDNQGGGYTSTNSIGRVTISMKVALSGFPDIKPVYIQSSVSLRDYPFDMSF